jgi:putative hemolysin
MLNDRFGRPIKNLRISLTDKCNLKCIYCHREGEDRDRRRERAGGNIGGCKEAGGKRSEAYKAVPHPDNIGKMPSR